MGYEELDVVDPTAGEAKTGQEAAVSEVRGGSGARGTPPPPAACNRSSSAHCSCCAAGWLTSMRVQQGSLQQMGLPGCRPPCAPCLHASQPPANLRLRPPLRRSCAVPAAPCCCCACCCCARCALLLLLCLLLLLLLPPQERAKAFSSYKDYLGKDITSLVILPVWIMQPFTMLGAVPVGGRAGGRSCGQVLVGGRGGGPGWLLHLSLKGWMKAPAMHCFCLARDLLPAPLPARRPACSAWVS